LGDKACREFLCLLFFIPHTMRFIWDIGLVGNFSVYCSSSLTLCASFGS
jgi:hypothetical protein